MGEVPAMPDSIDRLKQLLFDSEAQTLADLAQRIDALAGKTSSAEANLSAALRSLGESEGRSRAEIAARIDDIVARVGDNARLEQSVAAVLDGALRRAESENHADISDAVAPFVVNTVRTEIRNSRDELVEALYPVTGRIVKAYVASAMKDLVDQINRRLEMNPVMLRLRSLTTGRSVAELAIADSQRLTVDELYLIRRGTGELVERWPADGSGNRDQVMSGVLTAINEFATEAFDADGNAMRHIDLGGDRVYLRESVAYLLAAKCSGSAPVAVEQLIDEAFLESVGKLGSAARDDRPAVLSGLADTLTSSIADKQAELAGRSGGISPIKLVAALIGLPLAAWIAWTLYADWRVARTERIARDVLTQSAEIRGYPAEIAVGRLGESLTVTGLVPAADAKRTVIDRLKRALPGVIIADELAAVPNPLADVEPELDRLRGKADELSRTIATEADALSRTIASETGELNRKIVEEAEKRDRARAATRLSRARSTLASLTADLPTGEQARAKAALAEFDRTLTEIEKSEAKGLTNAANRMRSATESLSALLAARPQDAAAAAANATPVSAVLAAAEDAEIVALALAQTVALRKSLPVQTAREKVEAWTRAHAIFFSEADAYRDVAVSKKHLTDLAALMSGNSTVVRIVGYTDGLGGADRNSPLSLSRANKVEADLVAAGVPRSRLVVIGRTDLRNISNDEGTGSPNRRVEFEVGFEGEARR
jgi:outer membrane protein OmpA-like peptidoglycan-associated protein